jgi:hypothetical protein
MPQFKTVHADDNKQDDNAELVGSTNLKEVLQKVAVIRGSFSINGQEFRNFEARSPGEVARRINSIPRTGVRASIDDGFHLVLEADGPDEIAIGSGHAADVDRHRQALLDRDRQRGDLTGSGDTSEKHKDEDEIPDVLEMLGLEATPDLVAERGGADWQPGMSAEDRKKRREERQAGKAGSMQGGHRSVLGGRSQAEDAQIARDQGKLGPSAGTVGLNKGPSDTTSADPHNPPGGAGPLGGGQNPADDGMGRAPPENPQPGTSPSTTENPSL